MMTKTSSTWYRLSDSSIPEQGDILFDFPLLTARYDEQKTSVTVDQESLDLIVLTQSCDLENGKVTRILVAPTVSLSDWLLENPFDLDRLEEIRRGFDTSLYLLPSWPSGPKELERDRVVDFGHLQTIEAAQVTQFVGGLTKRGRVTLVSPADGRHYPLIPSPTGSLGRPFSSDRDGHRRHHATGTDDRAHVALQ